AHVTGPSSRATVTTSTPSSGHISAHAASTSHGPAQSSSSAPSNRAMPMRMPIILARVRGLICAGGEATRLGELTRAANKHLLPVGRWPMIYYPLHLLQLAGVRD